MKAPRRGFALIFVLWVVVSASALAMAMSGIGRCELGLVGQRMSIIRSQWVASGCLEQFRASAEEHIWSVGYSAASVEGAWSALDRLVPSIDGCHLETQPSGLTLNVNRATQSQLTRLFLGIGLGQSRADSVAAAIIDWRDADDRDLDGRNESQWYRERGRIPPRNGPFMDVAELALVRGVDAALLDRGVVGVDVHRILWRRADPAVLSTLPGMTDEALAVLAARGPARLSDLTTLGDFPELSAQARDSLARASQALLPMLTSRIESWTVFAIPRGQKAGYVRAAMRLGLRDDHLAVLEWRLLP